MPETALWRLGSQSVEGVVLCTGSRCRKWYEWCLRKGYYRACWYYPGCSITSSLTVLLLVISKYSTVIFIQNFLQRTPFAFQINFVFVRFSLLLIFHIIVVGRMDLERRKCFFCFLIAYWYWLFHQFILIVGFVTVMCFEILWEQTMSKIDKPEPTISSRTTTKS